MESCDGVLVTVRRYYLDSKVSSWYRILILQVYCQGDYLVHSSRVKTGVCMPLDSTSKFILTPDTPWNSPFYTLKSLEVYQVWFLRLVPWRFVCLEVQVPRWDPWKVTSLKFCGVG